MQAASLLDDEAIIVTDVGQHQMWTARNFPFRRSRQLLTSGGLGTMGFGLPAAIGASLACPDRKVVCFSGDGSIMMNIQELATAVDQQTPVKIILMNNNALGLVRQLQELFYGKRIYESVYPTRINFVKIAEGFGMTAYDLTGVADPRAILETAFKSDAPCLIHAPIDMQYNVYPMVPPGASNKEMIGGKARVYP
jgi:acetolactate synthase-1/2/3 large subunit